MYIHGIVLCESDPPGDKVLVQGADVSWLGYGHVFSGGEKLENVVGWFSPSGVCKIFTSDDCKSDSDRALFDMARGQPFIRATAHILFHKDEIEAAAKQRFLYWTATGVALEKQGGLVTKSRFKDVLLCAGGGSSPYRVFPGEG